jgi:probable F420-dependent oxidoreductase
MASFGFESPRAFFDFVEHCEVGGVDSLWQTDRLVGGDPTPEALTTLAAVAGATERIKFGMNAVVVPYRDPLVLAKQCATVDYLSNGRLLPVFGVGFERDPTWQATGRDPGGRGRRANEALELLARLWSEESVSFQGEFYQYREAAIAPRPIQQPLPLWIGGASKAAIRRTARLGTGWLGGLMPADQVGPVIRAIRSEAERVGRRIPEDHYGATVPFRFGSADDPVVQKFAGPRTRRMGISDPSAAIALGDASAMIERIRGYVAAGASKFVCLPLAENGREVLEQTRRLIAEVLPVVEAPGFSAES